MRRDVAVLGYFPLEKKYYKISIPCECHKN